MAALSAKDLLRIAADCFGDIDGQLIQRMILFNEAVALATSKALIGR